MKTRERLIFGSVISIACALLFAGLCGLRLLLLMLPAIVRLLIVTVSAVFGFRALGRYCKMSHGSSDIQSILWGPYFVLNCAASFSYTIGDLLGWL
jgi:hypothetical protein